MRCVLLLAGVVALAACSSSVPSVAEQEGEGALRPTQDEDAGNDAQDEDAGTVPTYDEIAPLINAACRPCHWGTFDSLAKVKTNRAAMLEAIRAGRMPQGYSEWKDLPEGRKVLEFLGTSPLVQ